METTDGRSPNTVREHDPELQVIYATGFSPVEARPVPGSLTLHKPYQPGRIVKAVRQTGKKAASSN